MMKRLVVLFVLLPIYTTFIAHLQEASPCTVILEQLTNNLYLDVSLIPDEFDRATLRRLYIFLDENVVPNCRSPYGEYVNQLPVILRYVPYTEMGQFPMTTAGFAGWCDVVTVECDTPLEKSCDIQTFDAKTKDATLAFLALVAIPDANDPDYLTELWGFTAHEIAHTMGAIDGPRFPFYEYDHLLAPIECVSDTYYWFGIAGAFKQGWQGIVWDAFHDSCSDDYCAALRHDVFHLDE